MHSTEMSFKRGHLNVFACSSTGTPIRSIHPLQFNFEAISKERVSFIIKRSINEGIRTKWPVLFKRFYYQKIEYGNKSTTSCRNCANCVLKVLAPLTTHTKVTGLNWLLLSWFTTTFLNFTEIARWNFPPEWAIHHAPAVQRGIYSTTSGLRINPLLPRNSLVCKIKRALSYPFLYEYSIGNVL